MNRFKSNLIVFIVKVYNIREGCIALITVVMHVFKYTLKPILSAMVKC